jgi:CheY-like chemotaxis protein
MNYAGKLEKCKLTDILSTIKEERLTGVLAIKSQRNFGTISFNEGTIIKVYSAHFRERFGRHLIEQGLITDKDLRKSLMYQKKEGKGYRIGDILVRHGFISQEQLIENIQKIMEEIVFSMVYWGGIYRFEPTKTDEEGIEITLDVDDFIQRIDKSFDAVGDNIEAIERQETNGSRQNAPELYGGIKEEVLEAIEKVTQAISSFVPREKVILVEDEKLMRTIFTDGLINFGYDVESFDNPTDALDQIARNDHTPLSLVLVTDIVMPGISSDDGLFGGLELVAELNQKYPNISIVVMTSIDNYDIRLKSLFMGASYFLNKPDKRILDGDYLRMGLGRFVEELSLCIGNLFRNKRAFYEREQLTIIREELIRALMDARVELSGAEKQLERDIFDLTFLKKTTKDLLQRQNFSFIVDTILGFLKIDNDRGFIGVVRKGEFKYFRGFSTVVDSIESLNRNPDEFVVDTSSIKSMSDVAASNSIFQGALPSEDARIIQALIGGYLPRESIIIPFRVYDKTVAILYCDNAPERQGYRDTDQIKILTNAASLAMQITVLNEKITVRQ